MATGSWWKAPLAAISVMATAGLLQTGEANAQLRPPKSAYTSIELAKCKPLADPGGDKAWRCEGFKGFGVTIRHHGGQEHVSVARSHERTRADQQAPPWPASVFPPGHARSIIEWRLDPRSLTPRPAAAIVRYYRAGGRDEMLVVIKAGDGESCHVAHVAATGHPDAIVTARRIADESAAGFDCRREPSVVD